MTGPVGDWVFSAVDASESGSDFNVGGILRSFSELNKVVLTKSLLPNSDLYQCAIDLGTGHQVTNTKVQISLYASNQVTSIYYTVVSNSPTAGEPTLHVFLALYGESDF